MKIAAYAVIGVFVLAVLLYAIFGERWEARRARIRGEKERDLLSAVALKFELTVDDAKALLRRVSSEYDCSLVEAARRTLHPNWVEE